MAAPPQLADLERSSLASVIQNEVNDAPSFSLSNTRMFLGTNALEAHTDNEDIRACVEHPPDTFTILLMYHNCSVMCHC
jgi:hypothetical protein